MSYGAQGSPLILRKVWELAWLEGLLDAYIAMIPNAKGNATF